MYIQFDLSIVKLGAGARFFTVIIESAAIPDIFVELNLDPVVIRASVAGGALFLFGLWSTVLTGPIIVPDINVSFKLADFFRLGLGCVFVADFNHLDQFFFAPYLQARFVIEIGGKPKAEAAATEGKSKKAASAKFY